MTSSTVPVSDAQRAALAVANQKSVGLAYVLWFFFGLLGVHRFYAGKTGSGIALLLISLLSFGLMIVGIGFFTIGFSFLWLFIDLFLIPAMIRDANTKAALGLR